MAPLRSPLLLLLATLLLVTAGHVDAQVYMPTVPLYNAAQPGVEMPVIGLGTGSYGQLNGTWGEYWDDDVAEAAVAMWLAMGGRRLDTSLKYYHDLNGVRKGIHASGVPREEVFITSKVDDPFGYNNTMVHVQTMLKTLNTTYVDLVLIHWPAPENFVFPPKPSNESCSAGSNSNWTICRQETWKALETCFKKGQLRAIGVSNFEEIHLQSIFALDSLIPAVNQIEYHPYWHEDDLVQFCWDHNITVNGYAPLGAPDFMSWFPEKWPIPLLNQSTVVAVAEAHGVKPAQVLIRWSLQNGLVTNPRTLSYAHMKENLNVFDFELTEYEMETIANIPHPLPVPNNKVCPDPAYLP
eukprot:TRINITY_DN17206_c0_g1_i1.p2 TRINITY_DN17206_c0_g1~~TRINITY_DN17206_c0_g1_i1.p2  ORF type:complete len:353 (+),score=89.82 TRINITY_DN17206_c0_g1_i1:143-1201(+)